MSNAISKRNRISLGADFTERFAALLPFATHDVCEDDVDAGTDEQRIAYLMGWYLRAIQVAGVPSLLKNLVVKQVEELRRERPTFIETFTVQADFSP